MPANQGQKAPATVLALMCAGAIVAGVLLVGTPEATSSTQTRLVTASDGVVQSTISGSGSIEPDTQLDLGFKAAGVIQSIDVKQGQHVVAGQLLASLAPRSAEVTLQQARATLQSARASLSQLEESEGESTSSGAAATGKAATASAAAAGQSPAVTTTTPAATSTPAATTPAATTTPATTTPAETTQSPETSTRKAAAKSTTKTSTGEGSGAGEKTTSETKTQSAATREANLSSAKAAVASDELSVRSAEEGLADTKLYAPTTGTLVTLSGEVGESVSASGTSKADTSSSSSSSSSSAGTGASAGAGGGGSSATAATGSGSSSSSFAVLSDLSSMELVVGLSESEIVHVHVGQPATVTVEALESVKLAAHVAAVSTLASSSSSVVSYDVTFQIDQLTANLRPGMSAAAEVVVSQAEGVNVPTSAISGGSVTVMENGKQVIRPVTTGLAGNSTTIILSGLKSGEQVVEKIASTTGSSSSLASKFSKASSGGLRSGLGGTGAAGGFTGGGFAAAGGPPGGP